MRLSARTFIALSGAACLAVAATGVGVASTRAGSTPRHGLIHACIATGDQAGQLYYLKSGHRCKHGWHEVTWNGRGRRGPAGTNGADGNTLLHGDGAPSADLGNNGDVYLDITGHTMYGPKLDGEWPDGLPLTGPGGLGGPPGANGTNGHSVLNGGAAPSAGDGSNGDFWIDTTNNVIYGPKANGAWPAQGTSLTGPAGPGEEVFTQSGENDYTVPAGVTHILVTLRGSGGYGGNEVFSSGGTLYSSGGGGQGALLTLDIPVTAGQLVTLQVGVASGNDDSSRASTISVDGVIVGTAGGGHEGGFATTTSAGAAGAGGTVSFSSPATAISAESGADGHAGQTVDSGPSTLAGGLGGGTPYVAGSGAQGAAQLGGFDTPANGYATLVPEA